MILSQLLEISSIDNEIQLLHDKLTLLYEQRADICNSTGTTPKETVTTSTLNQGSVEDSINFEEFDISLID